MRFGADEVLVGKIFLRELGSALSVSFHHSFFCDGTQRYLHWGGGGAPFLLLFATK